VLLEGLGSPDPLVRFSAAESLAYLDQPQAAAPLADAARNEIAFRWRALTALAVMDYVDAYDALIALLDVASAETRYGAFFALRTRNPYDPVVRGESLGDDAFSYHVINSSAEPMVHFTRSRRPEVVTFGRSVAVTPPPFLFAGKEILLKATEDGRIKASRFRPGQEDQHQLCDPDLDSVIRCVAGMGAGYADVMVMVHKAREEGYLKARVMVDAMPKSNRRYDHSQSTEASGETSTEAEQVPELFFNQIEADPESIEVMGAEFGDEELPPVVEENGDQGRSRPGFFGRISDWLAP
jgi:hypothetical protein